MMRDLMKKVQILLVDEDELFRLWVRQMLEEEEDMEIVGDCTSAEEALSRVEMLSPNIVLMDTSLPEMNGIEACRHLTGNGCGCDVIMLSGCQDWINDAVKAGAAGYYPKNIRQRELVTAIRLVCKWQSLRSESDASIYSVRQIETMVMENLDKFSTKQTCGEDQAEWLLPEGNSTDTVREVTLVVPSPGDASQLRRFTCRAEETLQARLLETVGSWRDTRVTLQLRSPVSLVNVLDRLMKMPEVEEVVEKEEVPARTGRFSFFRRMEAVPRKMIWVTLNEQVQPSIATPWVVQYPGLPELQPQMAGAAVR